MSTASHSSETPEGDSPNGPSNPDAAVNENVSQQGLESQASDASTRPTGDEDLPEYEPLTPELVEDEAIRGDFMLRCLVVFLAFLMASTRIAETQTLVHVKSGQYMAAHNFLPPSTDVFSTTAAERPWINLSWLFDLLLAGGFAIGGGVALSIIKALLAAIAFWFLVNLSTGRASTWGSSICVAVALLACHTSLTAQPEIITLLGLSSMLWIFQTWKERGPSKRIWALVPLFFFWSNLDPRMFLGLVFLLLYGLGDILGVIWGRPSLDDSQRRPFQASVAASFVATLLNPFGWHALLSPFRLYAVEYPAFREFLEGASPSPLTVRYYALFDEGVFSSLGHSGIAAIVLFFVAAVAMTLNIKRLDLGQVLVFFGFTVFGIAGVEQLPAAAIVFAALAALNGQSWYQATFSQEYSTNRSELIFSRGGRVLTVLVFFGMALMAGFGWLRPPGGGANWYGMDYMLEETLKGLQKQAERTFDDRGFNFFAHQGDTLIWVGQKPFIDSRMGLYAGRGDDNLLKLHRQTRDSLRIQHQKLLGIELPESEEEQVEPDAWKEVFDKYQLTHALPRLSNPLPDYPTLMAFVFSFQDWQMTDLSGAAAIFHRIDKDNKELLEFVRENGYDFVEKAFREEVEPIEPRAAWVKPPSGYQSKLWDVKRRIPEPIQYAQHLNVILRELTALSGRMPLRDQGVFPAMAILAVRNAQRGLDDDPSSAEGYVALGDGYRYLAAWNQTRLLGQREWVGKGFQFFQALQAYNQAVIADPDNAMAHMRLFEFYNSPNFFHLDLALRELTALKKILQDKSDLTEREMEQQVQIESTMAKLEEQLDKAHETMNQALAQGANPVQLAQLAYGRFKCSAEALSRLETNPQAVMSDPSARLLQLALQLEVGRAEEAYDIAIEMEQRTSQEAAPPRWRMAAAGAYLANADYEKARELWRTEQDQIDENAMMSLLGGLPPRVGEHPRTWPAGTMAAALNQLVQRPTQVSSMHVDLAFSYLETGDVKEAVKSMRDALDEYPNSPARSMIVFYLHRMTDEFFDEITPLNRVPVIFADGTGMKSQQDAPAENNSTEVDQPVEENAAKE